MHWAEVGVFDANAAALGIDITDLMEAAGQGLAGQGLRMLAEMGVPMEYEPCFAAIDGPISTLNPISIAVPGDPSSAAFFICLAAMVPGSNLQIPTMLDNPGRTGFLKVLERMGARFEKENPRMIGGEPVVDLRIVGSSLHGTEITASEVPSCIDEIPALSVVMSCARGPSRVSGASELRVKEADRISGMVEGLKAMGAEAEEFRDGFTLSGDSVLSGAELDGLGDHRLVMALTIAAAVASGGSSIHSADHVSISFPGFDRELTRLGVNITRA